MSFEKNSTDFSDLSKLEEISYQTSESKYHLENIRSSLQDAIYHLKKYYYHVSLIKECSENIIL